MKYLTEKAIINLLNNPMVDDVVANKIRYEDDFYYAFSKYLEEGTNAVVAYKQLGFNIEEIGENCAYAMETRIRKKLAKGEPLVDKRKIRGEEKIEKYGKMTLEEELAYYKSRSNYFELSLEFEKKTQEYMVANSSSFKKD